MAGIAEEWAKRNARIVTTQISNPGQWLQVVGPDPMRYGLILVPDQTNLTIYTLGDKSGYANWFMPGSSPSIQLLRSDWGDFVTLPVWSASPGPAIFPTVITMSYAVDRYEAIMRYYSEQFSK